MRMILIPRAVAAIGIVAALASCGRATSDDRTEVVAAFYPLFEAASAVGGDRVRVTNLTPAGAEPHDLEPTTDDLELLGRADLVLYLGGGFQPALEDALGGTGARRTDLLSHVDVIASGDPHVWLDPVRMREIVSAIAEAVADVDAAGAERYRANADAYTRALDGLHRDFADGLARCETRLLVTSHAAFGYLADRYGLRQEPIAGISPGSEPNPQRLAALARLVREEGVHTIFTETLVSPRVAATLAREAGVRTAVLDPLEGLAEERLRAGDGYLEVMRDNLLTLRRGLRCEGAA